MQKFQPKAEIKISSRLRSNNNIILRLDPMSIGSVEKLPMNIKTEHQIQIMRQGGAILAGILKRLENMIEPGISGEDLDKEAARLIKKAGAIPSFLDYKGYPKNICVSINEEVVHGIPSSRIIAGGDLVGIDIGVLYRGLHTDAAITVGAGKTDKQARKLLDATKLALYESVKIIKDGASTYDIGKKIYEIAGQNQLSSVRDLCGHGIGEKLQEPPSVFNFPDKKHSIILKEGMTICVEPMFTLGQPEVKIKEDGWTVFSRDRSLAAHFEHTLLVMKKTREILTTTL